MLLENVNRCEQKELIWDLPSERKEEDKKRHHQQQQFILIVRRRRAASQKIHQWARERERWMSFARRTKEHGEFCTSINQPLISLRLRRTQNVISRKHERSKTSSRRSLATVQWCIEVVRYARRQGDVEVKRRAVNCVLSLLLFFLVHLFKTIENSNNRLTSAFQLEEEWRCSPNLFSVAMWTKRPFSAILFPRTSRWRTRWETHSTVDFDFFLGRFRKVDRRVSAKFAPSSRASSCWVWSPLESFCWFSFSFVSRTGSRSRVETLLIRFAQCPDEFLRSTNNDESNAFLR